MKKIIFVLFVTVSMLFVSCQAKYKEVVLEDGTVVYTLESDDVDAERAKRIVSKSLQVAEKTLDNILAQPSVAEEYSQFSEKQDALIDSAMSEYEAARKAFNE